MDTIIIYVLIIAFVATLIRSTFGFGEALLAVPMLSLFVPLEIAVPLAVLLSITIALVIVIQDRQHIHFSSAKWLILFAIMGIPLGLLVLAYGNEHYIKAGLGLLIIAYCVYSMAGKKSIHLEKDSKKWLFICGFLSGLFGGAYGISGPPLVVYGNMRKWSAQKFRATLQNYFLPSGIVSLFGYWYKGLWDHTVTHYYLIALPAAIPAIFLGRHFNKKLKDRTFFKYVYIGLIIIGVVLVAKSYPYIMAKV